MYRCKKKKKKKEILMFQRKTVSSDRELTKIKFALQVSIKKVV